MQNDIEARPNTVNWASLLRDLLSSLGFHEVWIHQGGGNYNNFIAAVQQRLTDTFIQNWTARLEEIRGQIFIGHSLRLNYNII